MQLPPFYRAVIASILAILAMWAGVFFGDEITMAISSLEPDDGMIFLLYSKAIQTVIVLLAVVIFIILCRKFPTPSPKRKQYWLMALPAIWIFSNAVQIAYPKLPEFPVYTVTFGVALFVGVSEELVFRYILHRTLAGFSTAIYVLLSSCLFGMLHYQGHGFLGVIITMFVGATLDLARVKGAPMWLLIFFHAAIDFILLLPHVPIKRFDFVADIALIISIVAWLIYVGNPKHWRRPGTSTGLYTLKESD